MKRLRNGMPGVKRILAAGIIAVLAIGMTACGGNGGGSGKEPVESANGYVSVVPAAGYTGEASESYERVTLTPDGAETSSHDFIDIEAPGSTGYHRNFRFYVYSDSPYQYNQDEEYTMDMLKSDIDLYIATYPNIYSNPTEVTLGDYTYIRVDCITNAQDANYYYTIVNGKPCTVGVVGGEKITDIASDDIIEMIESIKFTVK